jgi:hypothetical protein
MVRISGLVRIADGVRRQLAAPMTAAQRDILRAQVQQHLADVHGILNRSHARVGDLPAPSQRAYRFLAGVDWTRADTSRDPAADSAPKSTTLAWRNLTSFLERAMDRLAGDLPDGELRELGESITRTSRQIELTITRSAATAEHMSPITRAQRGWLAYLSLGDNLLAYVAARKTVSRIIDAAATGSRHYPPPVTIHFRPLKGIYKLQRSHHGTLLWLPTPMLAFEESQFITLASFMFHREADARQRVIELMTSEAYQTLRAELESLGGVAEQSRGASHDLGESFNRVNAEYFSGRMARPRLTWNRTFTGRKFGHYDYVQDTVMVSRTLDSSKVPAFVVDFLVFHELLHKFHGVSWSNGRGYAHTAEFYESERKFRKYEEAEAMLEILAREAG